MSGFCICIRDCKNVLYLDVGHEIGVSFLGFMQYLNMGCKIGILLEGNATPTCGSQNKCLFFGGVMQYPNMGLCEWVLNFHHF